MTQSNNPDSSQGDANNARQQAAPTYGSRVRSLLGIPDSRGSMVTGQTLPPVDFQYSNAPSTSAFFTGDVQSDAFVTETTLPSLEGQLSPESIDYPKSTSENVSRSIEMSTQPEAESTAIHGQTESDGSESAIVDDEVSGTSDMPRPVYRRTDSANQEVSHVDEPLGDSDQQRVVESVQDEISIEQLYQENVNVQQFDMDVPGVSQERLSFPALSDLGDDQLSSENRPPRQRPSSNEPESSTQSDNQPINAQFLERLTERLYPSESRGDKPQANQQSNVNRIDNEVSPLQTPMQDWREDDVSIETQPRRTTPAPRNQQPDETVRQSDDGAEQVGQPSSFVPSQAQQTTNPSDERVPITVRRNIEQQREFDPKPNGSDGFSNPPYQNADSVNRSYRDAMEQIEQLRSSMQQLAARDSSQSQNNGQERRNEEPPRQMLPPPPHIVIVQRTTAGARAPRAFWERRYLGHLRSRTLR